MKNLWFVLPIFYSTLLYQPFQLFQPFQSAFASSTRQLVNSSTCFLPSINPVNYINPINLLLYSPNLLSLVNWLTGQPAFSPSINSINPINPRNKLNTN
jgi:hypothetical protein